MLTLQKACFLHLKGKKPGKKVRVNSGRVRGLHECHCCTICITEPLYYAIFIQYFIRLILRLTLLCRACLFLPTRLTQDLLNAQIASTTFSPQTLLLLISKFVATHSSQLFLLKTSKAAVSPF